MTPQGRAPVWKDHIHESYDGRHRKNGRSIKSDGFQSRKRNWTGSRPWNTQTRIANCEGDELPLLQPAEPEPVQDSWADYPGYHKPLFRHRCFSDCKISAFDRLSSKIKEFKLCITNHKGIQYAERITGIDVLHRRVFIKNTMIIFVAFYVRY